MSDPEGKLVVGDVDTLLSDREAFAQCYFELTGDHPTEEEMDELFGSAT